MTTAIGLVLLSSAGMAQSTGVAVCDDFITKYDACITGKVPQAQQATFKGQIEQMRKMQADQMKTSMGPMGCTF